MTPTPTPLDLLGRASYIQLTTFKRDGTAVPTPVWVVRVAEELQVVTLPNTGKVKRIRNSGLVTLAPCTVRGVTSGDPVYGTARIMTQDEIPGMRKALGRNYAAARFAPFLDRLRGLIGKEPRPTGGIAITVDRPPTGVVPV